MSFPDKPKQKREVYLDHASATPLDPDVFAAVEPWLKEQYANPSALYKTGVKARNAVETSRKTVADVLKTNPDTIIFTGSGTESINIALVGAALRHKDAGKHIISTKIEHSAVKQTLIQLEKEGFEVTHLPVDEEGKIKIEDFKKALRPDTILVTLMYVNNEIGTINPIDEIGREILKWRKKNNVMYPLFHSDACQAICTEDLSVEKLHVDLLSLNASKAYGPKGVGVLHKRRGVGLEPIVFGGGQEFGVRSGTENVGGIVGVAKAFEIAGDKKQDTRKEIQEVRDYFWSGIKKQIENVKLNGPDFESDDRVVSNLNVSFVGVEAEALVLYLDEYRIMCSKGSACETDAGSSHVLEAIGLSEEEISGAVRFTLGRNTTKEDIDYVMIFLPEIVAGLRSVSV